MMFKDFELSYLWTNNFKRLWVQHLYKCYLLGYGKDFETINFWYSEFKQGKISTLIVDRDHIIIDGHHRLIAAHLAKIKEIKVRVCPQKTTYR